MLRFREFAANGSLRPALHAYGANPKQRNHASGNRRKASQPDRDLGRAANRSRARTVYAVHTWVSKDFRTGTYVVFFDDKAYKGLRLPAILEGCEKQNYHPFVPVAEPPKSVSTKPTAKART